MTPARISHKSTLMATLKLTIDKRRSYDDGRYPIVFRLTSLQQSTSIKTDVKLRLKEWDSTKNKVTKVHPDHTSLNLHLKNRLLELERKLLDITFQSADAKVGELKETLLGEKKQQNLSFKEFAENEIQILKDQERFGNANCYQSAVNRLLKFIGGDITIDKITYSLIVDFDAHLIKQGICKNTVAIQMRELRALINKAIHKGLLDRNKYPFAGYKIRTEKTVSRAITIADMQKLHKEVLVPNTGMWHSRNIFFLIFNLIGISFIDLVSAYGEIKYNSVKEKSTSPQESMIYTEITSASGFNYHTSIFTELIKAVNILSEVGAIN